MSRWTFVNWLDFGCLGSRSLWPVNQIFSHNLRIYTVIMTKFHGNCWLFKSLLMGWTFVWKNPGFKSLDLALGKHPCSKHCLYWASDDCFCLMWPPLSVTTYIMSLDKHEWKLQYQSISTLSLILNLWRRLEFLVYVFRDIHYWFFFSVNIDILRKWVIQTLSWIWGPNVSGPCSGGAAPRRTGLRPVKHATNRSPERVESHCWSDR